MDYTTIHSGITERPAQRVLKVRRYGGIVSKGGTITAAWMLKYDKENPYFEHFDYMCEIARKMMSLSAWATLLDQAPYQMPMTSCRLPK